MLHSNEELPETHLEQAQMLESIATARATGRGDPSDALLYKRLRSSLLEDPTTKKLLPAFVRTCRTLDTFWPWIKKQADNYADRRQIIASEFTQLVEYLEGSPASPSDTHNSGAMRSFDADGVHQIWVKALDRRIEDPEGAITVARTLLETVTKRILDERYVDYSEKDDLPKLYRKTADCLNLTPAQHSEEAIKSILGGAITLVNGIGTLRNKWSDSHGRGGRNQVRPTPRHANLAVNTAGAIATFLVETHLEKSN